MPITLKKPKVALHNIPGATSSGVVEARTLNAPLSYAPPRDSILSHWWASASDSEKISRLVVTDTPADAELHALAVTSVATAEEELFRQLFFFLVHEATDGERMCPAQRQLMGHHIAAWLRSGPNHKRLLGEALLMDPRVAAGLGDAGAVIAEMLIEHVCQRRPTHLYLPVRRAMYATKAVVRSRAKQSGPVIEALMTFPLPDSALATILQSMLEGEALDLAAPLPLPLRQNFQSWLSKEIVRLKMDTIPSIHPTWIATDPIFTAQRLELQPLLTPAGAVAAALYWPTAYIPQLLALFEKHPDEALLPVLAAAARNHSSAVPPQLFARLAKSPEEHHRTTARRGRDSVARTGSRTALRRAAAPAP